MKLPITVTNFSDYFRVTADTEDVTRAFGYGYRAAESVLPHAFLQEELINELQARISRNTPFISLTSEGARREFLVAPIVAEAAVATRSRVRTEYFLQVSDVLRGTLDYFLRRESTLLVIEAKLADLTHGFTQLAVELIALDQWEETDPQQPILYGAVTTGDIWKFGYLIRSEKLVVEDLNLYRSPADLHELLPILVGILTNVPAP